MLNDISLNNIYITCNHNGIKYIEENIFVFLLNILIGLKIKTYTSTFQNNTIILPSNLLQDIIVL